jgi:glycosyltransferase involved in cell wall biosynthesis
VHTVTESLPDESRLHRISVVIPVYGGEFTLGSVVDEVARLAEPSLTPDGHRYQVIETLLVYDNGHDKSDETIRELATKHPFVRPVWLSRNFGQHPATLAGMASSSGDWIVTLDEDGQHDPADMAAFLDTALRENAQLVYAEPTNPPPHGAFRNLTSKGAKWLFATVLAGGATASFQSYRLVLGEVGRSVAAYAGAGVYLDVAMQWVSGPAAGCPVELRDEGERRSGYSLRRLLSHFWRLVLSSGTRGLRLVSVLGVLFATAGIVYALFLLFARATSDQVPQGWTSTMVVVLLSTGAVLFSLGIIAEYIGVAVNMAMGKPPYLIVGDPEDGPLGSRRPRR